VRGENGRARDPTGERGGERLRDRWNAGLVDERADGLAAAVVVRPHAGGGRAALVLGVPGLDLRGAGARGRQRSHEGEAGDDGGERPERAAHPLYGSMLSGGGQVDASSRTRSPQSPALLRRSALAITVTELRLIAAAATIGERSQPSHG